MRKQTWLIASVAIISMFSGIGLNHIFNYDFKTLDGHTYKWSELKGEWVVVNYFAEWCAPCLREVPELNRFYQYSQETPELRFFAISYDALESQQLSAIKSKYNMAFPLILSGTEVMPNSKPGQLPATFIISPEGQVSRRLLGEIDAGKLKSELTRLKRL